MIPSKPKHIKTRYRDVPYEEVQGCIVPIRNSRMVWESFIRNTPVTVSGPLSKDKPARLKCNGPIYHTIGTTRRMIVCIHMLELRQPRKKEDVMITGEAKG